MISPFSIKNNFNVHLVTMDLRFLISLCVIFFSVNCEVEKNSDVNNNINTTTVEEKKVTLKPLCGLCVCKDGFINCRHQNLTNDLKEYEWPKETWEIVTFEYNHLVHLKQFLPSSISILILRNNQVTKIDERAFKALSNLVELDLSYNSLTSEVLKPNVFEGEVTAEANAPLEKLKILDLSYNALDSLDQFLFQHISGLRVLRLEGNRLTNLDMTKGAINSLIELEELDLSACELQNLPNRMFHQLGKSLKKLNLNGNQFNVIPSDLEDAEVLEYLNLDKNPIKNISGTNIFPIMPRLKTLSLCNMRELIEIGAKTLSGLGALETLNIKNNPKLDKIHEDALSSTEVEAKSWPPLKCLDLSDNALRYMPRFINNWDKLEKLDLMNNKWSCDCENQFLIGELLPQRGNKLMNEEIKQLKCSAPPEHNGKTLISLSTRHLRCLDIYGAQPEKDASILIGVIIGLLVAIPIGLLIFTFWRRGYFFCNPQSPASFSRAFYKRTPINEE